MHSITQLSSAQLPILTSHPRVLSLSSSRIHTLQPKITTDTMVQPLEIRFLATDPNAWSIITIAEELAIPYTIHPYQIPQSRSPSIIPSTQELPSKYPSAILRYPTPDNPPVIPSPNPPPRTPPPITTTNKL
ncbi:uncharacterized protein BO66DRAFT_239123 [Aspergillus aculeatinus CBS 121060]|uniref:Uncharacterized protein n=1 Tax=Aspergillus aculeatinus CBS 121060 TaxID=1448322 RepID=A0ACD1HI11_9EURO|nr:hypothetical protein BO66DRAFT_239123 [Aspergillus aculeatinus CBS 121060]RAH73297.1 hypothetical protein BO66DRAFT_239123 [Aspergillus aculeatinus CBS 121060]